MTKVLMVVSGSAHWTLNDGTKHPTGFWAEELITPHDIFEDAGFDVDFATPGGVRPTLDENSMKVTSGVMPNAAKAMRKRLKELDEELSHPLALADVNPDDYDIVFYPGGHGPMEDLAQDKTSGSILNTFLTSDKIVGVLCHSPASLLATVDENGKSPFSGRKVTSFSTREEKLQSFGRKAKWFLEEELERMGMDYSKGLPFTSHVVVDGNLYSGQNPQSSKKLAETIVEAVKGK
ncbi:MAG: type 1 glutamine amidotransferase domain-containing protein [Corynebacterium sp.]|uniref:type 1 glutamine amidotransferase domain-containing protein n=1 Tax=Corynebacterium sp. TaxID=1720 RepID=UPI0026DBD222|nr:type 1 glutamine amidotransferase domain-containing protein [Corynebacterium sp.]MDO5029749.1 type 1 glutamine amidotransferase domain-containing protein [Corynebacterium sp.]